MFDHEAINKITEETYSFPVLKGKVDKLRLSDGIVVTAWSIEELQRILNIMDEVMKNECNKEVNKQTTKILMHSQNVENPIRITMETMFSRR